MAILKLQETGILPHKSMLISDDPWQMLDHRDRLTALTDEISDAKEIYRIQDTQEETNEVVDETPALTKMSEIKFHMGRVSVYLSLEKGIVGQRKKGKIIDEMESGGSMDVLKEMEIWGVEFSHNARESLTPTNGFCGYVAVHQIMRGLSRPANLRVKTERDDVSKVLTELLEQRRNRVRDSGNLIKEDDEVERRTKNAISRLNNGKISSHI